MTRLLPGAAPARSATGIAAGLCLTALLCACPPYYEKGDAVRFTDPGPGAAITYRGAAIDYGEDYFVAEGSAVVFDWTAALGDRYRWLYCSVSPGYAVTLEPSAGGAYGRAAFTKTENVATVTVGVAEYSNDSLLAAGDVVAWARDDAVYDTRLAPAVLYASASGSWAETRLIEPNGDGMSPAAWRADGTLVVKDGGSFYRVDAATRAAVLIGGSGDGFTAVSPDGRYFASPGLLWYDSTSGARASMKAPSGQNAEMLAVCGTAAAGLIVRYPEGEQDLFVWSPAAGVARLIGTFSTDSMAKASIAFASSGDLMVALNNGELRRYTAAGGGPYTASIPVGKPSRLFSRGSSAYLETSAADADAPFCVLYSVDPGTAASPPVLSELTRVDWADGIEPLSAGNYAYRLNAREEASRKYRDIVISIAGDIRVITPSDAALLAPK